ncbi:TIGR01777 family oxidoreductase [Chryseobacterium sp. A301]
MNTLLIAGGTGFIGKHLTQYLLQKGHVIHALTRTKKSSKNENLHFFQWDIEKGIIDEKAFEGVDVLINLTGANITEKRWTAKRKKEIVDSRVESINLLFKYVRQLENKPTALISSSAVGYYGAVTTEQVFTELSPNGTDFLAYICKEWENAAFQFNQLGIRTIVLRKGIIIGKEGGMYAKTASLAKWSINTALGNGKQFMPWIDIRDLIRLYEFILSESELSGIFNTVSTQPISMNEFSKLLLRSFGKKSFLPNAPKFIIQLMFGEMAAMLLEGSKVSNEKIIDAGFVFQYDTMESALH